MGPRHARLDVRAGFAARKPAQSSPAPGESRRDVSRRLRELFSLPRRTVKLPALSAGRRAIAPPTRLSTDRPSNVCDNSTQAGQRALIGPDLPTRFGSCTNARKMAVIQQMSVDTKAFAERLAAVGSEIEAELDALLGFAPREGEPARPKRLVEAMRYAILGGGKRLRPFLVVETARALGEAGAGPRRVGAAIECLHGYSLIHDDLPAMDDDDLRRGRPTVHRAFDEATAILAGDALLTLAFEIIAAPATGGDAGVRAALCAGLARAAGLAGMVGGQMLDLAAEQAVQPLDGAAIAQLQAMKTGALLRFSVEAGGLIAGASELARAALKRYGDALGAAFQIADDLLDVEGDAATMGKRVGKDADRNKATFVAALGLEGARAKRDELVSEAIAAIDALELGAKGDTLRAAARFVAARKN